MRDASVSPLKDIYDFAENELVITQAVKNVQTVYRKASLCFVLGNIVHNNNGFNLLRWSVSRSFSISIGFTNMTFVFNG